MYIKILYKNLKIEIKFNNGKFNQKYRNQNGDLIEIPDKIIGEVQEDMQIHIDIQIEGVDGYLEQGFVSL